MPRSLHRDEREQVEPAYPSGVHPIEPLAASYPFPNGPRRPGVRELDGRSGIPEEICDGKARPSAHDVCIYSSLWRYNRECPAESP
jgi:hypothetical protein